MISSIYNKLTPFNNSAKMLVPDQQVSDIITGMLNAHTKYAPEYQKIAQSFAGRDVKSTARNIYDFLKKNVNYVIEPDDKQMLKSPSAILYTGKTTGSDCKNYALFTAGILDALNRSGFPIKWAFRYASYKMLDKMPHHTFVVINPDTNKEIWIDPVLNGFNLKKQYYYKLDKKPKNMALISLAGIGASKKRQEKKAERQTKRAEKKAAKPEKKAARTEKRKEAVKKVANKLKTTGKAVIKVAGAPVRNSFLLLVKVNFKNLAGKLKRVYDTNPDKLKTFWSGFSGQWDSLVKAINTGVTKKALGSFLGAPVAAPVAVAVTTASPILVKLAKFLKDLGIDPETIQEIAQEKLNQIATNVISKVKGEAQQIEAEEKQEIAQTNKEIATEDSGSDTESGTGTGLSTNTMLLIGAGAVGLFLLTRKK
jgi:vacuolar-type H+-ATPase subunit E/Vma4